MRGPVTRAVLYLALGTLGEPRALATSPEYCNSDSNADAAACFASNPAYCSSATYADRRACSGAKPAYCESTSNAGTRACAGPGQPASGRILWLAQRSGRPVDVGALMEKLMR